MGWLDWLFGSKRKESAYSKGLKAERKVKKKLEKKGWLVRQSKGSRGPYDLYALKSGKKLLVQVKSGSSHLDKKDKVRLRQVAKKKGAKALLIHVKGKKTHSKFIY
jgi:Holliday junction resolvase